MAVATKTNLTAKSRVPLTLRSLAVTLMIMGVLVTLVAIVSIMAGSEQIHPGAVLRIIAAEFTGRTLDVPTEQRVIILDIRLPRTLMAIVVGGALAVAGASYQALLRNPLADPYILGVSTGAAVGAIAATVFAESLALSRPLCAFAGAILTIALVYALGQGGRGGGHSQRLILAGIIVNTFLSSVVIFLLTAVSDLRLRSVFSWLIGDLSSEAGLLPLIALFVIAGIAVILINARSLNILMIGEEDALALGVEVRKVKVVVYVAASLITGAAVAVSGVIGFVGLVIPHAVRLAGGSDNRLVIPGAALAGAAFLLLADTVARTVIAPSELHIGVITALIGAPAFIYLLRRSS